MFGAGQRNADGGIDTWTLYKRSLIEFKNKRRTALITTHTLLQVVEFIMKDGAARGT